nr:MAG TPA: hypothetical protein [Caudoviricetes sp.]
MIDTCCSFISEVYSRCEYMIDVCYMIINTVLIKDDIQ